MNPSVMYHPDMKPPQQKGWFGRNWKWFVPVGCLSMVVMAVAVVAAIFFFAFGAIKSSDPYQQALAKARSNPVVVSELGEPIKPGFWFEGSINVSNDSGNADMKIPVSGPKKSGAVHVVAEKKQGKWYYSILEFEIVSENKKINLLTSSSE